VKLSGPLVSALVLVACSAVEPQVGPIQASCPGGGGYGVGYVDSGYGGGAGYDASSGCIDPRCLPDGGYDDNACDSCENTYCCAKRFACYADSACFAADKNIDACVTAAADAGAGDAGDSSDAIAACWSTFTASGTVAMARVACQRRWCQTPCGVP
jgi:hypothetical protein